MRVMLPLTLAVLVLFTPRAGTPQSQSRDDERNQSDVSIGIGFGIDKVNFDERTQSRGVTYFTGNVRFNFWGNEDDGRSSTSARPSRLKGFLEAEVGYWNDEELAPFQRDLLLGLNAIANVHAGTVDVFFGGGFGYHWFGSPVALSELDEAPTDDGAVGANMQFGRRPELLAVRRVLRDRPLRHPHRRHVRLSDQDSRWPSGQILASSVASPRVVVVGHLPSVRRSPSIGGLPVRRTLGRDNVS